MLYEIDTSKQLNWAATGNERIIQNAINILNTRIYEVAYARLMGLAMESFDGPVELATAKASTEIISILNRYEPRISVKSVDFIEFDNDDLKIRLVVEI